MIQTMSDTLPKGWAIAKLGDLCEIIMGQSPPSDTYNTSGIGLPFFQGKKEFTELHPRVEKWCSHPNKIAEIDDILISVRAPVGDTNIANQKCCIGRGLAAIRYRDNNRYVLYYLKLIKEQLNEKGTGTTFKAISGETLKETIIPLAPLNEQKRILAKLEQLLTDLDKGIEYLETTKQQLKVYRQAVLKWAFEGKLTNRDVIDGELPNGWDSKKISQVAETFGGYAFKSGEFESQGKFQVIRMGNVRPGVLRLDESPVFISQIDEKALNKALLKVNDIIVTQTGTKGKRDYGFTALISKSNLLLNQRIAAIRCNEDCVPKFLLYYTWTNKFKDQFFANETGNVGQGNVGMKAVTDTIIWIPKPAEQIKVISEIESRLSVCEKIEETIESSLQQAEALRLSIIKKAFEGKLVPQDPNDEPAEKLLERIKALRHSSAKTTTRVRSQPAATDRKKKGKITDRRKVK